MNKKQHPFLHISKREFILLSIALTAFMIGALVFTLGFTRFNRQTRENAIPAAIPTTEAIAETARAEEESSGEAAADAPTPVLAPTMAPTVDRIEHTVQAGETLLGIAATYNVNVQTILDANTLTVNSVLQPGQLLIIPLLPDFEGTWHIVSSGESLFIIAEAYGVTAEEIQKANGLQNLDEIRVGQRLYIPFSQGTESPEEASAQEATTYENDPLLENGPLMSDWPRSITQGDLAGNYPLTYEHERFTLHYQPGTYSEYHLEDTIALIGESLTAVEERLGVQLEGRFDAYVAGTLYAFPDAHLRGRSYSLDRRVFFLLDGGGEPVENKYIVMHELTHMVSWNTWGAPSSMILSEGLATSSGIPVLEGGGYMPYEEFCVGAYAAGVLPSMDVIEQDYLSFLGHNRHRYNYFGSACFVNYLIKTYGLDAMRDLYHTSDYAGLYGESLYDLNQDWQQSLEALQGDLAVDQVDLVNYTDEWVKASDYIFKNYNGTIEMHRAYAAVDQARLALWQADYEATRRWLDEVYAITGYIP